MSRVVTAFGAERYVIALKSTTSSHKLFQIGFTKSDASMFVAFPYSPEVPGILGVATLRPDQAYPTSLTIGQDFPVTRHVVKYSHHPSGRAHFSLTGKVRSAVSRQACKLQEVRGHLFTVMAQGIDQFKPLGLSDKTTAKRGIVPFGTDGPTPTAIKIVGHLWDARDLQRITLGTNHDKPWLLLQHSDGSTSLGILLATPVADQAGPCYLVLSFKTIPRIIQDRNFFLSFMGGFDQREVALDHSKETSWLTFIYPASSKADYIAASGAGTIDIAT